jgi:hypothetical protein
VVASDLNDEKLHNHADLIVRSPGGHIATREQMILGLSQVALFYPGHLGTLAEFFDTALQNYCVGRGRFHYSPPIAIFVSPRYYNEQTKSDSEEHFYTGALDQFLESSPKFALSKGESYDWLKVIITPSPQRMKSLTPDEREWILKPLVGEILNHMETHIANKFGDTLNAGYGNGIDLRQHYICSYAQGI